jgi:hypothetical protein
MKCIFSDILLLIGAIYLFSMCSNNNVTHADYNINHYVDTINGHIILTTVCDNNYNQVSISTLELKLNNN